MAEPRSSTHADNYHDNPRAVKIGAIENGDLNIDKGELIKILGHTTVADLPVCVIGIVGVKRSGKSVLMNLLIRELQEGLKDDQQLFIYNAKPGACTEGVWAWSKPLISTTYGNNNKQPFAILLIDTQGTGDNGKSVDAVANMVTFSALSCSTLIYNVDKTIVANNLDEFAMCANIANDIQKSNDESTPKLFQNLNILIRNFDFDTEEYGFLGGASYLKDELKMDSNRADNAGNAKAGLGQAMKNSFEKVACCLLPSPTTRSMKTFTGTLNDELHGKDFVREIKLFIKAVLNEASPMRVKSSKGQVMTCRQWIEIAADYAHALTKKSPELRVQSLSHAQKTQQYTICRANALKMYDKRAVEETSTTFIKLNEKGLAHMHAKMCKECIYAFENDLLMKMLATDDRAKKHLVEDLEQRKAVFIRMNENVTFTAFCKSTADRVGKFVTENPKQTAAYVGIGVVGLGTTAVVGVAAGPVIAAVAVRNPKVMAAITTAVTGIVSAKQ